MSKSAGEKNMNNKNEDIIDKCFWCISYNSIWSESANKHQQSIEIHHSKILGMLESRGREVYITDTGTEVFPEDIYMSYKEALISLEKHIPMFDCHYCSEPTD